jgi:flagellar hook assembly protein FlgD
MQFSKGTSTIKWDASDKNGKTLPSGAYFIKQKGGSYKDIIKVMYLK